MKNEPLPEMYSADTFAKEYNRKRCAEYYLRTVFFPAAKEAAIRGEIEQVVITIASSAPREYPDMIRMLLKELGWITYYTLATTPKTTVDLVAILPV